MSWLKKVFKKEIPQEAKPTSRAYRVRLLPAEFVFQFEDKEEFAVTDLSESGLAMQCSRSEWQKGTKITGKISTVSADAEGEETIVKASVELEVMRNDRGTVGCRFSGDLGAIKKFLWQLFREEIQASEMYEISSERIEHEQKGKPRWYYAPGNYSLFLSEENGQVVSAELTVGTTVYLGLQGKKLRWGSIAEEDREKPSHARSNLIRWNESLSKKERKKALRVVENLSELSKEQKVQIRVLFEA